MLKDQLSAENLEKWKENVAACLNSQIEQAFKDVAKAKTPEEAEEISGDIEGLLNVSIFYVRPQKDRPRTKMEVFFKSKKPQS